MHENYCVMISLLRPAENIFRNKLDKFSSDRFRSFNLFGYRIRICLLMVRTNYIFLSIHSQYFPFSFRLEQVGEGRDFIWLKMESCKNKRDCGSKWQETQCPANSVNLISIWWNLIEWQMQYIDLLLYGMWNILKVLEVHWAGKISVTCNFI